MLPPWDDGHEHQSDFQFTEFIRNLDPQAVARDRRRIHTPTPREELLANRRDAARAHASAVFKRRTGQRASGHPDVLDGRIARPRSEGNPS